MPEHYNNITVGFEGGSSSCGDPLPRRSRRKLGLPAIDGDILPRDTTTDPSPTPIQCPGCLAEKPKVKVGDAEEETLEYGAVHGAGYAVENINSMWNLGRGRETGTLTLTDIEIWKKHGACVPKWKDITGPSLRPDSFRCESGLDCKYWFVAYFELLANTPHAASLMFDRGAGSVRVYAQPLGPTFLPSTRMWRYHYDLEFTDLVKCGTSKEIKFDKNSSIHTFVPGSAVLSPLNPQGTNPVIIRISCSDCPNPLV